MMSLSLTNQNEKEDIELLLSSVAADLDEIETEIKIFIDMIEDTDQFISAHLDSVRNEIIKMSLFIEVGGLIMVKVNIWFLMIIFYLSTGSRGCSVGNLWDELIKCSRETPLRFHSRRVFLLDVFLSIISYLSWLTSNYLQPH